MNFIVSSTSATSTPFLSPPAHRRRSALTVTAASRPKEQADHNNNHHQASGKLIDESMIVLRLRIHEMKMAEQQRQDPAANWLEWEKRCYSNYDSHICLALGYLQSHLMNTRPSVVFGSLALVLLSLPISSAVVLHSLFHFAAALLAAAHLS